ncbi:hypothetical protein AK812_SmicGene5285 [Symbiodinium microadriaticum]|uniref:CCHC-type domain-containing protein n=1 Tax=Symbiodinium microadriaticum TaxID=2951 RepID=A0A1Q9EU91_SYMMI|nr:hypothetical protein AK812_SmicGene5285 [Symbiodinium microadriaticum]
MCCLWTEKSPEETHERLRSVSLAAVVALGSTKADSPTPRIGCHRSLRPGGVAAGAPQLQSGLFDSPSVGLAAPSDPLGEQRCRLCLGRLPSGHTSRPKRAHPEVNNFLARDFACQVCGGLGHWWRNCPHTGLETVDMDQLARLRARYLAESFRIAGQAESEQRPWMSGSLRPQRKTKASGGGGASERLRP